MQRPLLFLLLSLLPLLTRAQADSPKPTPSLKPIEEHLMPLGWGYYRYGGPGFRNVYSYDGIDVRRPTELAPYIRASNDPEAIALYNRYEKQRSGSNALYGAGGAAAFIGMVVMLSNPVDKQQERVWVPGSAGYAYGSTVTGQTTYGGYYDLRTVDKNENGRTAGFAVALSGVALMTVGAILRGAASNTLHRSVQYYNRALRRPVSVSYEPFAGPRAAGLSLTARF
jgi:hypothetical protein